MAQALTLVLGPCRFLPVILEPQEKPRARRGFSGTQSGVEGRVLTAERTAALAGALRAFLSLVDA